MKSSVIILPGNQHLSKVLLEQFDGELVDATIKEFPDGESYVRLHTSVSGQIVFIVGSLNQPNSKLLPLIFLTAKLKEMGAIRVVLVTPYLPYMRQDKEFHSGECVTSVHFAQLLSSYFDHLITLDPHLHRHRSLNDLYNISTECLQSAPLLAKWIPTHVRKPVIFGPDIESKQWVSEIATLANTPYIVLSKQRLNDDQVILKELDLSAFMDHTPVLVDDIISTAGTMSASVNLLNRQFAKAPVCLGIHAIFSNNSFNRLVNMGVPMVVTTNSIYHESNGIDISPLLASAMRSYLLAQET